MTCKLTIIHRNTSTEVLIREGLGFQAICAKHKTPIEFDCREADCGICIFKVRKNPQNLSHKTVREAEYLKALKANEDERLACQARVMGDITIELENWDPN